MRAYIGGPQFRRVGLAFRANLSSPEVELR